MIDIYTSKGIFHRTAWTGGDAPTKTFLKSSIGKELVAIFLNEQIADCGGLDLWNCAGISPEERLAIFQNRANLDAWATFRKKRS